MSLVSNYEEEKIWKYLKDKIDNDYGVAGLIGNLFAESGLKSTNMQDAYQNKLGYNDDTYTKAIDDGVYTNFINDKVGYGIAQWTYHSRKKALYEFAKSKNKSIGDLEMQLDFLIKELSTDYKPLLAILKTATSVKEASNAVLLQFERPADQSVAVQDKRISYGKMYYDKFHKEEPMETNKVNGVQKFTNSPLVSYTKISPNKTSPRTHVIDTITIHCVVGQTSVESLGSLFAAPSRQASSNYGVGYDGKIGMYVEEKDRSWCSSNSANDNRAITIEVASDTTHPYAVKDAAYESLIKLVADICKRNNIKELKWKADKSLIGQVDKQNMTVHRWFENKSCPGDYLYNRHGDIAEKVNKLLGVTPSNDSSTPVQPRFKKGDVVKLKTGAKYTSGKTVPSWLLNMNLYVRGINGSNITISTLKTGAITGIVDEKYLKLPTDKDVVPSEDKEKEPVVPSGFKLGDVVKLTSGAKYTSGKAVPEWLLKMNLYVRGINGSNITISTLKTGAITGIVNEKYLTKISATSDNNVSTPSSFKNGDAVKLKTGAKYIDGKTIPSWLLAKKMYVRGINGDNITISWLKIGAITGTVNKKYLERY